MKKIVVLPGDGVGPEVIEPTIELIRGLTDEVEFEEYLIGGASIDEYGLPLTDATLRACKIADGVLLGAVGGPKWDTEASGGAPAPRPEEGLLDLRKKMDLYANIRPVVPHPALYDRSPLGDRIKDVSFHIVRELTGGIYFGDKTRTYDEATDVSKYSRVQIERIATLAFIMADLKDTKVTSVDKANVLATSQLWRDTVTEVSGLYDVPLEHMLVDNAAMQMIRQPDQFSVILTENMFGDILSDEAAVITGSIGTLPSLSLNFKTTKALAEPVHGSAPDIAGKGIANPIGAFRSAAMLLHHLEMEEEAATLQAAVDRAIFDGVYTPDIGGASTTWQTANAVLRYL